MSAEDAQQRFDSSYVVDPVTGCWLWTKAKNTNGYAAFKVSYRQYRAHRWAWEQKNGPVPPGKQLDHFACNTAHCVNPEHVRPVSAWENGLRSDNVASLNRAKTHCHKGHPFTPENTGRSSTGNRACRTCAREASQRYRERRRPARVACSG